MFTFITFIFVMVAVSAVIFSIISDVETFNTNTVDSRGRRVYALRYTWCRARLAIPCHVVVQRIMLCAIIAGVWWLIPMPSIALACMYVAFPQEEEVSMQTCLPLHEEPKLIAWDRTISGNLLVNRNAKRWSSKVWLHWTIAFGTADVRPITFRFEFRKAGEILSDGYAPIGIPQIYAIMENKREKLEEVVQTLTVSMLRAYNNKKYMLTWCQKRSKALVETVFIYKSKPIWDLYVQEFHGAYMMAKLIRKCGAGVLLNNINQHNIGRLDSNYKYGISINPYFDSDVNNIKGPMLRHLMDCILGYGEDAKMYNISAMYGNGKQDYEATRKDIATCFGYLKIPYRVDNLMYAHIAVNVLELHKPKTKAELSVATAIGRIYEEYGTNISNPSNATEYGTVAISYFNRLIVLYKQRDVEIRKVWKMLRTHRPGVLRADSFMDVFRWMDGGHRMFINIPSTIASYLEAPEGYIDGMYDLKPATRKELAEANITFREVKGSIKKMVEATHFNHNQEARMRGILAKEALEDTTPMPLSIDIVPEAIVPYILSTRGEMALAGKECNHCIGSYKDNTNPNRIFFRKENICAEVNVKRGKVGQCYDVDDTTTKASTAFRTLITNAFHNDATKAEKENAKAFIAEHLVAEQLIHGGKRDERKIKIPTDPFAVAAPRPVPRVPDVRGGYQNDPFAPDITDQEVPF